MADPLQNIQGLTDALWLAHLEDKYTDMTISCGDRTFRLHKSVICGQSKVFSAMMNSGFKEGQTNHISLSDQDPVVFQYIIEFLYGQKIEGLLPSFEQAIHIYAACDKYDIPHMRTYATRLVRRRFLADGEKEPLTTVCGMDLVNFFAMIPSIYDLTPSNDDEDGLRSIVLEIMHAYAYEIADWEELAEEDGRYELKEARIKAMTDVPEFAVGIYEYGLKHGRSTTRCSNRLDPPAGTEREVWSDRWM